jgi:hypothetical protein
VHNLRDDRALFFVVGFSFLHVSLAVCAQNLGTAAPYLQNSCHGPMDLRSNHSECPRTM